MRSETKLQRHGERKEASGKKLVKPAKKKKKSAGKMVDALDNAIGKIQDELESANVKGTIADLVRLLQLRNELTDAQPRQVTVRWVDECQTTPVNVK